MSLISAERNEEYIDTNHMTSKIDLKLVFNHFICKQTDIYLFQGIIEYQGKQQEFGR